MTKIEETIKVLIDKDIIPYSGLFDITEDILIQYINIYQSLSLSGNTKHDIMYARKLAGLNLFKLKLNSRGGTHLTCKEGILYFIKNPACPAYLKVGITTNIDARLATYQTGDPTRSYSVKHYEFVLDRKFYEKSILNDYKVDLGTGEWIKDLDAVDLMDSFRKKWNLPQGNRRGHNSVV